VTGDGVPPGLAKDIDLVEWALSCVSGNASSHGGSPRAYIDYHGCRFGWLCNNHYMEWVRDDAEVLESMYIIRCDVCDNDFTRFDDYVKIWYLPRKPTIPEEKP
jgi:hypothetical protein